MPESRSRKKQASAPPTPTSLDPKPNPAWFLPVMLGLMIVGLLWVVAYYITETRYPIPSLGNWNLVAGFALILAGFGMTTRWR